MTFAELKQNQGFFFKNVEHPSEVCMKTGEIEYLWIQEMRVVPLISLDQQTEVVRVNLKDHLQVKLPERWTE